MSTPPNRPHAPAFLHQRYIDELTVLATIAQAQTIAAEEKLEAHPLSPRAHLRIHTLREVTGLLAALITMFASVGLARPLPKAKPRHPRPARPATTCRATTCPATARHPALRTHRAGAAPNPNPCHRARTQPAPQSLTHPGATAARPPHRI